MAKFLFPTGRKSYFMAVIPLRRIQRLAVGNRGGREAHQWGEGVFWGALLGASPNWALAATLQERVEKGRNRGQEPPPETRSGLCPMEKNIELSKGEPRWVL